MITPSYLRPPITEAVIEVSFMSPLMPEMNEKLGKRLNEGYGTIQAIQNYNINIPLNPDQVISLPQVDQMVGQRCSSRDQTELALLWPNVYLMSQLAPYPGWAAFSTRFRRDWKIIKEMTDYRPVSQISVRYINRIDVETSDNSIQESDYLNFYPKLPTKFGALYGYSMAVQVLDKMLDCVSFINSSVIPSPLIGHASILLDISVIKADGLAQRDEAIMLWLDKAREKKNEVFEACITDIARGSFGRG